MPNSIKSNIIFAESVKTNSYLTEQTRFQRFVHSFPCITRLQWMSLLFYQIDTDFGVKVCVYALIPFMCQKQCHAKTALKTMSLLSTKRRLPSQAFFWHDTVDTILLWQGVYFIVSVIPKENLAGLVPSFGMTTAKISRPLFSWRSSMCTHQKYH